MAVNLGVGDLQKLIGQKMGQHIQKQMKITKIPGNMKQAKISCESCLHVL